MHAMMMPRMVVAREGRVRLMLDKHYRELYECIGSRSMTILFGVHSGMHAGSRSR
jgi:hypothetical protein